MALFSKDERDIFAGLRGIELVFDSVESLYSVHDGQKTLRTMNNPTINALLDAAQEQNPIQKRLLLLKLSLSLWKSA